MFENKKMEEESNSKKENENQISLQKLIKLDCRDSNFLFKDQLRNRYFKVHYPHTSTDLSPGQHLLKRFWTHVESHYFKKFQKEELYRLDYLKSIFNQGFQNHGCSDKEQQFCDLLNNLFTEQVVHSFENADKKQLDRQNLLDRLYISWKKSQIQLNSKSSKNLDKKMRQCLQCLQNCKNKKKFQKSLQEEQKYLKQVLSWDFINGEKKQSLNQIQKQIQKCQLELNQIQVHGSKIIQKIQTFVQQQTNLNPKLPQNPLKSNIKIKRSEKNKFKKSQIQTVSEQIHSNLELKEIQFIVTNLEERQLAESMSKILQCRKINGQFHYLVSFQQAMYVEPKLFSQKQLIKLNKLRETSMFMFYRTGVKSLYSYTCQSYAGFAQLASNRHGLAKYKPKDIFQMMKKTSQLSGETLATFNKFYTCHHCKFLYPDYLLKTCKFSSDRQALPKNNYEASLDPDFSQVLHLTGQQDKGRVSQRFTTRKKNCLTGYAKINQQYVCGRKYCYSCLKDCYPNDTMNQSIFCPFCQGNCTCSRCLRSQKIVKFKNTYSLLGGDSIKLALNSCLQKLQNKQQNLVPKRRGRPKKISKKNQHISINRVNKKLKNYSQGSQLKLNGQITANQRRITLSNKKDKVHKKRLILRQKCLTSLLPKRKRGRPPKNSIELTKKSIKHLKNQVDQKQIENIFHSMNK